MFKNMKFSHKVFMFLPLIGIPNIVIFLYQVSHSILTVWSVCATLPWIVIVFFSIKNFFNKKVRCGEELPSMYGMDKPDLVIDKGNQSENVDFCCNKMAFPHNNRHFLMPTVIFCLFLVFVSVLMVVLKSFNKYDIIVTGDIVDQVYLVETNPSVSTDEVSSSEQRLLIMKISYSINNKIYEIEIEDTLANATRKNTKIDLCVESDGKFVCLYDKIKTFNIIFYAQIILIILTIVGYILKLPAQYLVLILCILVGIGIVCFANANNWLGWLLHDFTLFGGMFISVGLMGLINFIVLRIAFNMGRRKDPNYTIE